MGDELDLVRGTDGPFRDAGLADPDRFTIDGLVKILNHLDRRLEVHVTFRPAATTGDPTPAPGAE
jgi:hypothetical protein